MNLSTHLHVLRKGVFIYQQLHSSSFNSSSLILHLTYLEGQVSLLNCIYPLKFLTRFNTIIVHLRSSLRCNKKESVQSSLIQYFQLLVFYYSYLLSEYPESHSTLADSWLIPYDPHRYSLYPYQISA